jgi:hypothetical protein
MSSSDTSASSAGAVVAWADLCAAPVGDGSCTAVNRATGSAFSRPWTPLGGPPRGDGRLRATPR